ncbi:reverse transcriptase domain-containing protein [Tanacetum coccineum]|uniref:Reverse transcriptase domain-containing protein n=1 Tax=Tanacetum coccineum TaxID=301880 RepID=A0ABQ5ICZ9_9ASTR
MALLGNRKPGLGYMAKTCPTALYVVDTRFASYHNPLVYGIVKRFGFHQVVSMKKMNSKNQGCSDPRMVYEKLNALMFVPQQELSREQAYWLPANERASQTSNPNRPVTPYFVEQQLVPFYDHFKKHIQVANDTFFKEIREFEQIFDDLDAEYEQCVLDNKNLTIEKKNLLIKNDCLIAECLEKDICSIVLTSDIVVPPSSNCLCEDLRSACDREHTKVLELEAEISKQKQLISESEKRFAFLEQNYVSLQLKFQNYKQCIDTSSASNAIFEINKFKNNSFKGKDDTMRNLDAQIKSMKLDGLKVENVSLKRRYDELSKANTHSRTAYTEKLSAFTAENTKLKAQVTGKTSSGPSTLRNPKWLASGMYNQQFNAWRQLERLLVVLNALCVTHLEDTFDVFMIAKLSDRKGWFQGVIWSKERPVADSIAARLTRPTAYNFKTDCMILRNAEERDVVPPGYSYECLPWSFSDCATCGSGFPYIFSTCVSLRTSGQENGDTLGKLILRMQYSFVILWNAEERDVVPPGYSYECSCLGSQVAYLLIYVDDIILTASSLVLLQRIVDSLHKEFDMTDLGALNYFLGISAIRHPTRHQLTLTPNWVRTAFLFRILLYTVVLQGGLQYLTFTRPDLSYAVQQVALPPAGLLPVIIRNLLRELRSPLLTATLLYYDNISAVYMSANLVQHQRTKHIEIDIHFVRDMVKAGHVRVLHVPSRFQYADIFTKGLPSALFEDFHSSLSPFNRLIRWVLLLQGFDIEIEDKRRAENLAADHLSRLENPDLETFMEEEIADEFPDEHLMVLKTELNNDEPWYVDYVNYLVGKIVPPNWTAEKRRRFFSQVKNYFWDEPYAFKLCLDNIMRRCVARNEILKILAHCHSGPTGVIIVRRCLEGKFTNLDSSGLTELTNGAIRRILKRSVGYNPKNWSEKLDDTLWAFRPAYKTPTGCTPFRLVYGKSCHFLVEIKHKAYWALKQCNMDLTAATKNRFMELNELMELRDGAYENTQIYKERTKGSYDSRLRGDKNFKVGDMVLLFKSRFKMHPYKNGVSFKINGQRLKKYHERHIDTEDKEVVEFEKDTT